MSVEDIAKTEFLVRVALPDDAYGARLDLQGRIVVDRADHNGCRTVRWQSKVDSEWCEANVGSLSLSPLLSVVGIIDIQERGKADPWFVRKDGSEVRNRCGKTQYAAIAKDDGQWGVFLDGLVATGNAGTMDAAKDEADFYAAKLYDLEGGAFVAAKENPAATPQPPPTGDGEVVLDLVVSDLQARAEFGHEKYGTYLKTDNGRDNLMDAYQEALDLCMYLRTAIAERDEVTR